ncbi:MAG: beta-propeller fold lactonase family protein, partial [Ilumatobacteraceae bacterium]
TIPVGVYPYQLKLNPAETRLYVTNQVDNSVSVINTSTNAVVSTVSLSNQPLDLVVSATGQWLYVGRPFSSAVDLIDTSFNTVVGSLSPGFSPYTMELSSDGSRLYVTGQDDSDVNMLAVINTGDLSTVATVVLGQGTAGIFGFVQLNSAGSRLYVGDLNGTNASDHVDVIDIDETSATKYTVLSSVAIGQGPRLLDLSADGSRLYVPNSASDSVSIIDTSTNTVVETVPVGDYPVMVLVTPDGSRVYVTEQNAGTVSAISCAS